MQRTNADAFREADERAAAARELAAEADPEYLTRIEAQRCTLQFAQRLGRADRGKLPMDESPLFGGTRQTSLFDGGHGNA